MTDARLGLEPWVTEAIRQVTEAEPHMAGARLFEAQRLSGGAINQNFLLLLHDKTGATVRWVMRRSQSLAIPGTLDRRTEFLLIRYAEAIGLCVPRPLALVTKEGQVASFFAYMPGQTEGRRLLSCLVTKESLASASRAEGTLTPLRPTEESRAITEALGAALGRLHGRSAEHEAGGLGDLQDLLGPQPADGVSASLAMIKTSFDRLTHPQGYLRFAVESLLADRPVRPAARGARLCHNDFRLGNLMMVLPGAEAEAPPVSDWPMCGGRSPLRSRVSASSWETRRPNSSLLVR